MARSRSDQARKEWLQRQRLKAPGDGREQWDQAKQDNEKFHIHFNTACCACAQQFEICGLPCFVICPNCHLILTLRFHED